MVRGALGAILGLSLTFAVAKCAGKDFAEDGQIDRKGLDRAVLVLPDFYEKAGQGFACIHDIFADVGDPCARFFDFSN